ncbi:hypothetical protein O3M35_011477 [Rhynocoris fuscipes]|uniref:MEIOB-like N-terminal domain-containing protein n=1 Tax=Rhynocoris fuscipes TaxID=488301 RepID=A0AAW1D1K8_9HEMI
MSASGIRKITISNLSPNSQDFLIVGVIIAKRAPKSFYSRRDGNARGVWGFTLRDSPADYINVTAWGSPDYIEFLSSTYKVGDVVDITNTRVITRNNDDQFQPTVTSCMELVFNEDISQICLHDEDDWDGFTSLLHLPTKPPSNYLNLSDIKVHGKLLSGQHTNILVAVQRVGEVREISKEGKELKVLEVIVMDKTSAGFSVQIWDEDMIQRAIQWKPRYTVLFMSDIRVSWNTFKRCMCGTIGIKSIITENPSTREAKSLANYASSAPLQSQDIIDNMAANMPNPETIVNVMSCFSVIKQAFSGESSECFTALVYAVVHEFDLDGLQNVVNSKCNTCNETVPFTTCENSSCIMKGAKTLFNYNIRISLMDHTAKLINCRLPDNVATSVLGMQAESFVQLSESQRISLKWKYLLKKTASRLVILPATKEGSPCFSVVDLTLVTFQEYASKVLIY